MKNIPKIDVSLLETSNKDKKKKTIQDLYTAFCSIGYVSLTETGIKTNIVNYKPKHLKTFYLK